MDVLSGIKVVEVTVWAFVPSAGGVLAHWGADVVKVESPTVPDPMRLLGGTLEPGGASMLFKHYSRGKRSIGLDLTSDEGREILYELVADADVFLTSTLPASRRKLKIDIDDIRAVNPKIIYARGTGQGPQGPEAERGGYDGVTWWCRGTLAQSTMDVSGATWPTGMVGHGDGMSGMTLAGGICAALLKRERTGEPSVVDGSLLGTAIWFNGMAILNAAPGAAGIGPMAAAAAPVAPVADVEPPPMRAFMPANMTQYRTKDGRFLSLLFLGDADRDWVDLCEHLDRPDLATDERFASSAGRAEHRADAVAILDEIFAARTLDEWKEALRTTKGVWAPVQSPAEVYDDPQTIANGFLRHVDYPGGGLKVPVPPILFDEEAGDPPPAPDFAAHTDEILRELGHSDDDIRARRAVGRHWLTSAGLTSAKLTSATAMVDGTITQIDGRTVGFADYGVAGATAVLWCHGGPGSRLEPAHLAAEAVDAGLRIIGIDRPGYGLSTPQPGRTIADWVTDALAVADHLGVEQFVTVGVSTGGAFALAVAAQAPQRTLGVVLCGAMTDMACDECRATLSPAHTHAVWDAPDRAASLAASLEAHGEHGEKLRKITTVLPPSDLAIFTDPERLAAMTADMSAMFAHGQEGYVDDRLSDRDGWTTFDVRSITCPVVVLHGRRDPLAAVSHAEYTAAIVPTARLELFDELGHFSILEKAIPAIVELVRT